MRARLLQGVERALQACARRGTYLVVEGVRAMPDRPGDLVGPGGRGRVSGAIEGSHQRRLPGSEPAEPGELPGVGPGPAFLPGREHAAGMRLLAYNGGAAHDDRDCRSTLVRCERRGHGPSGVTPEPRGERPELVGADACDLGAVEQLVDSPPERHGHFASSVGRPARALGSLRIRVAAYALAGVLGVVAGLALTAVTTSGDANAPASYTLLSIAAVTIRTPSTARPRRLWPPGIIKSQPANKRNIPSTIGPTLPSRRP